MKGGKIMQVKVTRGLGLYRTGMPVDNGFSFLHTYAAENSLKVTRVVGWYRKDDGTIIGYEDGKVFVLGKNRRDVIETMTGIQNSLEPIPIRLVR